MNPQLKIGLYVASLVGSLLFGGLFMRSWHRAEETSAVSRPPVPAKVTKKVADTNAPAAGNASATAKTKKESSSSTGGTNTAAVAGASTNEPVASSVATSTNEVAAADDASGEPPPEREAIPTRQGAGVSGRGFADLVTWGLLAVVAIVVLGILIAYDVSHFAAQRATKALFEDDPGEIPENLYEQVEKAYGAGDFLEAVRLLREYLKQNPRGAHAQIRIAEIYEKDLNNPLAAALEYEEVMRLPLGAERRGWTGIHLVNLYNRLEKPDQAVAMMQRIVAEFPETPAALKARERLEASGIEIQAPAPVPEARPTKGKGGGGGDSGEDAAGGLPRGFRKR